MIDPDPTNKWYKLGAKAAKANKSMGPMANPNVRDEILRIGAADITAAEKHEQTTVVMKQYQYGWFLTAQDM